MGRGVVRSAGFGGPSRDQRGLVSAFVRPVFLVVDDPEVGGCGEIGQFVFFEEEASTGAGVTFEIADGGLHHDQDPARGESIGELRDEWTVEVVEADDEVPWAGRERSGYEIGGDGRELDAAAGRLGLGDVDGG